MWEKIKSLLLGCGHTYEPFGSKINVFVKISDELPIRIEQSHRCSKCGYIRIFEV